MLTVDTAPKKARKHEIIEDVFFGDFGPFTFTPGPMPDLISSFLIDDEDRAANVVVKAKFSWLEAGFGPESWEEITDAIQDPTDPLRSDHLFDMFDALLEEATKVPPTSPGVSSETPPPAPGAAKPRRRASTSGK